MRKRGPHRTRLIPKRDRSDAFLFGELKIVPPLDKGFRPVVFGKGSRLPRGSKNAQIMKIVKSGGSICQIWIRPVPRETDYYHLQFGSIFSIYLQKKKTQQ